jgi:transposase InsO family protein
MKEEFAYNKLNITMICEYYGVSRQAYYKSEKTYLKNQIDREKLLMIINSARKVLPREGGHKLYRRIKPELKLADLKIGRDKLFCFLREEDLLVKPRRSYVVTTNSFHRFRTYKNLISEFIPTAINQVWVTDITYIRTIDGFMYLALITDAYSRKIVGYDVSDSLELAGCLRALKMAMKTLPENHQLIHHSDRGIQYCSNVYTKQLIQRGVKISMAAKGNCYENAMAERVNGILKDEFYLDINFNSKTNAIKACSQAIELYNKVRTHMSINYLTPSQKYNQCVIKKLVDSKKKTRKKKKYITNKTKLLYV